MGGVTNRGVAGGITPRQVRDLPAETASFASLTMGLVGTSLGLALSLLVLAIAVVLDRRPYRPGKQNLVILMIIALAASLIFARHLLTLVL